MSVLAAISGWARFSPSDEFWVVTVISTTVSIAGFIGTFYYLNRKKVLEAIPTSKIRSAAQGYLELDGVGELMEGPRIIAPLTGTHCTWYNYRVDERRSSGKNSRWVAIEKGISDSLFFIVDDTGKCVIDPEGATVIPATTDTWYGSTPRPESGHKLRRGRWSGGRYRYTEMRMHPGDNLYAIGLYKTVGGANTDFNVNAEVLTLLREWKADSYTLLHKFDHNRDGQIDMQEWEHVRNAALQHVLDQHHEFKSVPAVNLLGDTRDLRRPFILSAIPQHRLIKRYSYYAGGLITLFFLAGMFACWITGLRYYSG
jgi:hypothetical protein